MALLTISKESELAEVGDSVPTSSEFHRLAGILACAYSPGILPLHSYHRNEALARKQRVVIVSAEFGDKQSHEIRPSSSQRHHHSK